MNPEYILSLDQGTTSSRAILFDNTGKPISVAQKEFSQIFPKPGWVEHNPMEILSSQIDVMKEVITKSGIAIEKIAAVGITNQRETTVVWNRRTGEPVCNAIVWQDRRTADICNALKANNTELYIKKNTGLVADAYFSGTKIQWILENIPGVKEKAKNGDLFFGTIDTWLIWNLTGGKVHATDVSNASRTMLFNLHSLKWDEEMKKILGVPSSLLPEVKNSADDFGTINPSFLGGKSIRISGVAGDQQAALFGQSCMKPGMAKNTYGTGCFMLMHTGNIPKESQNGLLTTIAWKLGDEIEYALEGSVFIAGAAIQWLRDQAKFFDNSADSEKIALQAEDNGGVYFVPAFTGLGAPWWNMEAKAAITGLTRGSGIPQITRAALEAIAYQTKDVLLAMEADAGVSLKMLKADGGATSNKFLMQFQADILGVPVEIPDVNESTALGAAFFAGIQAGIWSKGFLSERIATSGKYVPMMGEEKREELYNGWKNAVQKVMTGK